MMYVNGNIHWYIYQYVLGSICCRMSQGNIILLYVLGSHIDVCLGKGDTHLHRCMYVRGYGHTLVYTREMVMIFFFFFFINIDDLVLCQLNIYIVMERVTMRLHYYARNQNTNARYLSVTVRIIQFNPLQPSDNTQTLRGTVSFMTSKSCF